MGRYSPDQVKLHKSKIRQLLVYHPQLTIYGTQEKLKEKFKIELDKDYIHKLKKEIDADRLRKADTIVLRKILMEFMERIREQDEIMWKILTDEETKDTDKLKANQELRQNFVTLINTFFDAGVFERKHGEMKINMQDFFEIAKQIEKERDNERK